MTGRANSGRRHIEADTGGRNSEGQVSSDVVSRDMREVLAVNRNIRTWRDGRILETSAVDYSVGTNDREERRV